MPKKSSPLLKKVSNLLQDSIFIAQWRKPIIPRLMISLKRSKRLKKLMVQKHYSYRYIQEYQFSPSSTPLIHYYKKSIKKRSYHDLYSLFFFCKCLGKCQVEDEDSRRVSNSMETAALPCNSEFAVPARDFWLESCGEDDDGASVDEKAEKFIKKFYEEMRKQRAEAALSRANSLLEF